MTFATPDLFQFHNDLHPLDLDLLLSLGSQSWCEINQAGETTFPRFIHIGEAPATHWHLASLHSSFQSAQARVLDGRLHSTNQKAFLDLLTGHWLGFARVLLHAKRENNLPPLPDVDNASALTLLLVLTERSISGDEALIRPFPFHPSALNMRVSSSSISCEASRPISWS